MTKTATFLGSIGLCVLTSLLFGTHAFAQDGIWISRAELMQLPMAGPAWDALLSDAQKDPGIADLSNQHHPHNTNILAKALVCVRTGDDTMCEEVRQAVMSIRETENGGRTLALGRNLIAYVIAADLVGLSAADDAVFRVWLDNVRFEDLSGKTLISTHNDRPNNWGTVAGASRVAAAIYLGDTIDLQRASEVFHGWLGDRATYAGFKYGDLSWQCDPSQPVGINPKGCTKEGHSIDGVLPDDQRRSGSFTWPPPKANYVYSALQGVLPQAVILFRAGYDVFNWEDKAILRAFDWLHKEANFPATGDDTWLPHIINHCYGTDFPAPVPSNTGKNMGYTDWTHGPDSPVCGVSAGVDETPPSPPTGLRIF